MATSLLRTALCLILAPVAAALGASLIVAVLNWLTGFGSDGRWRFDPSPMSALGLASSLWGYGAAFGVPANLTLGVAWRMTARKFGYKGALTHMLAGAVCAAVIAGWLLFEVFPLSISLGDSPWRFAPIFVWAMLTGALTSMFAWLIRRPDRDPPASHGDAFDA